MSGSIWKFPARIGGEFTTAMPEGAAILSVQLQGDHPQIWVLVPDTNAPTVDRTFAWYGTGHPLPAAPGKFIASVQCCGGALVFHLFEMEGAP